MENEQIILELKEDTVDVEFTVKVVDNRLPGFHIENDGGEVFAVFYTKRTGFFGKQKTFLLDHFKVAPGSKGVSYDEAVNASKEFFAKYLKSKVLQRAYAAKIVNL